MHQIKKVVVAEDEFVTRTTISRAVEKAGYAVIQCSDGKRAFETVLDNPDISLLITDMVMPNMSGFELIEGVRGNAQVSTIPIIVVSGHVKLHEIVGVLEKGASRYLPKPIHVPELLLYVATLTASLEEDTSTEFELSATN